MNPPPSPLRFVAISVGLAVGLWIVLHLPAYLSALFQP